MSLRAPLDKRINFRVSAEEMAEIKAQSKAAGLTLSAYAKHRVLGHAVIASTDRGTRAELARIGGLIKSHAVQVADRRRCNEALDELIAASRRLGREAPK